MSDKLDYREAAEYVSESGDTATAANALRSAADDIERLIEALAGIVGPFQWLCEQQPTAMREMATEHAEAFKRAGQVLAAVLADEEDARPLVDAVADRLLAEHGDTLRKLAEDEAGEGGTANG